MGSVSYADCARPCDIKKITNTVERNEIYAKVHIARHKETEVYCKNIKYMNGK